MKIVLHNLTNSRSRRVLWLLEELGVPYELRNYQRTADMRRGPAEIRKIHPLGKAPTVEVDGAPLIETGAIFEYLLDRVGEGRLRPAAGTPERTRFTFWLHYAEGSVMQLSVVDYSLQTVKELADPGTEAAVARAVDKLHSAMVVPAAQAHMDYWESELGRSAYLAGDEFTAADIMMGVGLIGQIDYWKITAGRPRLTAWLDAIRDRPAYRRTLEKDQVSEGG